MKLIRQLLRAGYLEDWRYHTTYSGTPQGGVVSPILANIVLNELDNFIETQLLPTYNHKQRRRINPEYHRTQLRIYYARKKGRKELARELEKQRRQLPSGDPTDPNYRCLRYSRYADDFLLGFAGSKSEAEAIKQKIKDFLRGMKLELSEPKTLITHATSGAARYLGYDIRIACDNNQMTKQNKQHTKHRSRAINLLPVLAVPEEVARHWQRKYAKHGKPANRPELLQSSDFEIVKMYGLEFQGIVNYYGMAYNVAKSFYPVKYIFLESAVRTLANKHHTHKSQIYAKYKRTSEQGVKALIVEVPNPNHPNKPYQAKLGDKPIRTSFSTVLHDESQRLHVGRTELVRRLLANACELCGSPTAAEVHHIHKLADLKQKSRKSQNKPEWIKFMLARNRKSVVVCRTCHQAIHHAEYDGRKVNGG